MQHIIFLHLYIDEMDGRTNADDCNTPQAQRAEW